MKRVKEKNVDEYNKDVDVIGTYAYTNKKTLSSSIARKKECDEIIKTIRLFFNKKLSILDAGCGDGAFALELFNRIRPKYLFGFDYSEKGIKVAINSIPKKYQNVIKFKLIDIYDIDKFIKKGEFDIIIISGVLHHLYNPITAIDRICNLSNNIVVLEPNGYNPVLKIIEKISPYHMKHEEKSYSPFTINRWFAKNGYVSKRQYYFGIVPYFCPDIAAKILQAVEPIIEKIPIFNKILCRCTVTYYTKL